MLPAGYTVAFCIALPLFAAAGLVCILSFVPQVLDRFHQHNDDDKSLLYWGHIAEIPVGRYHERVTERYKPERATASPNVISMICVFRYPSMPELPRASSRCSISQPVLCSQPSWRSPLRLFGGACASC